MGILPRMKPPKYLPEEGLERLRSWCDLQERCPQEVRRKLHSWGYSADTINHWVDRMLDEGAIDEARFAQAFVSGKFRIKKWGQRKIQAELQFRGIPRPLIEQALSAIDPTEYAHTLTVLTERKLAAQKDASRVARGNVARYLISKGYEPDLVWETIATLTDR